MNMWKNGEFEIPSEEERKLWPKDVQEEYEILSDLPKFFKRAYDRHIASREELENGE